MTPKIFPKRSRYNKIMDTVYRFFVEENITDFPINPKEIIKRNKWGLISYSELANQNNLTISQVIESLQSEDGYVLWDGTNYTIAYNDTVPSTGRIRFTLMHEIGHIYLGHLIDFEETMLNRGGLNTEKYKILEREANAFARNVLAPSVIVKKIQSKFKNLTPDNLVSSFHISYEAASVRLESLPWDLRKSGKYIFFYLNQFKSFIYKILNTVWCTNCYYTFTSHLAKYCPICRSKKIISSINPALEEVDGQLVRYLGIELDEMHRAIQCPACKNEDILGDYCHICGTYLINRCTGFSPNGPGTYEGPWHIEFSNSCGELLSGEARYCHKCGSTSTFYESGLLESWQRISNITVDDDLPF